MLQNYSQETLDIFLSAVKGNRKAFKTLMETEKRPELAAFSNAIKGDEHAEMWLKARGGIDWWLMCKALNYNENALQKLQHKDNKFNVSFVLACQNRIEGKYWLAQNGYSHFFPICEAIAEAINVKGIRSASPYDAYQ
jgi:hypothetical protein